jgi:chitin disaccharide deacetylase
VTPRGYLVVNADDLGYASGVNRGIFEAHERGIVTSTSLMVHRPAAEAAAAEARARPALGLGLHVDLGEWLYADGTWRASGVRIDERDREAVAAEVRAQLERFRELAGREPTHLDSHQHVHRREPVRSVLLELASELGVPLRHESGVRYSGEFYGQTDEGEPLPDALRPERLEALLRGLPDGATELCCHPGYTDGLVSSYASEREQELRTLCSPSLRTLLADDGIELVSFAELREWSERRAGT